MLNIIDISDKSQSVIFFLYGREKDTNNVAQKVTLTF